MKTKLKPLVAARQAFSLVELLVVIAVIAIIAAIAIPNIANITDSAGEAAARRNAQNIASVYAAARAAGSDGLVGANPTALTQNLRDGVTGGGTFTNMVFRVDGLSDTDVTAAIEYLDIEATSGLLIYVPAGASEAPAPPAPDPDPS